MFGGVAGSETPPVAVDDTTTTAEDTVKVLTTAQLTANDTDADSGDTLTASLAPEGDVQHGTLTLDEDGSFTYVPDENWYGEDSFQYVATDGLDTVTGTVRLKVGNPTVSFAGPASLL